MKLRFPKWRRWLKGAGLALLIMGAGWLLLPQPSLYPEDLSWSRAVVDRHGRLVHLSTAGDGRYRLKTSLHDISPHWVEATLIKEDRWFRQHPGVNPVSLLRASWNVLRGSPQGGASTLTMQVARLRWKIRSNTIPGKLSQILRAIQLERHYSKDEILEAYFNLAPYGGNVEGAGAAARLWCGREPSEVTRREAIALSIIPQSPSTRNPGQTQGSGSIRRAQARLAAAMEEASGLRRDPLGSQFTLQPPGEPPHEAPHFCRRLLRQAKGDTVHGSIDLGLQQEMERGIEAYLARQRERGIFNACAILVHAPSRRVCAYVGSADYHDASIQGMVDGLHAERSPGSALKPFIYALALDHGLIHPRSLLRDAPMNFHNYRPENYEREFMGPIHADDALARSRNLPAVELARQLPDGGLHLFLQRSGLGLPHPASHYGLSLALGGLGVSPEELAMLYASLADDGRPRPLVFTDQATAPQSKKKPLLSPEARFLVLEMLQRSRKLGLDGGLGKTDPTLVFKTGTSHGFRDAWAAGIRGDYVMVVWLGNFNGRGNNALVAREVAVPLLYALHERLQLPTHTKQMPKGVCHVELCARSGSLPGPACRQLSRGVFIPGVSPIQPCHIHREILVDGTTGLRVARDDGRPGLRREIHEFWSPEMLELFRLAGLPRQQPPAPESGTDTLAGLDHGEAPRIVSPLPGRIYRIDSRDGDQQIQLEAKAAAGVRQLYWFCGEAFIGSSEPDSAHAWQPEPGEHVLRLLDDHGRSSQTTLRVSR